MKKLLDILDKVSTWSGVACFVVMAAIMTVNIFARFFSGGLTWYMESAQYLNIWCVFLAGLGLCATNDHLRIDAIDGLLKPNGKKWMHFITALITAAFYVALAVSFFHLATRARQTIATIPAFKMAAVYWPIPFLCCVSAVASVLRGIYELKTFGREEEPQC